MRNEVDPVCVPMTTDTNTSRGAERQAHCADQGSSTSSFSALQTFEIVASREDFPASRAASAPGLYDVVRGLTPTGSPISVAGEARAKWERPI